MKAIKISTIFILLILFAQQASLAEKIYCKKYTGSYKDYILAVTFTQNGKLFIEVEENKGGGYFSTPGSYTIKNSRVDFFYRGLNRSIFLEKGSISATPYTFSINDDYKTPVILKEDTTFPATCK
jgi:hypothetical protein